MTDLEKINAYVESHRDEMLETYRKVILQESYHSAPEEVRTMGKMFKEMFEEVGFRCKLTNVGTDESGDMLTGILGEDRPGKPIIFGGHMDTVHKLGSFPCKFEVDDEGKVHGPGVLDMKGGIVIALYVCKALNEIGYNSRPLKICFAPDEEKLHKHGNTADQFVEFCKAASSCSTWRPACPAATSAFPVRARPRWRCMSRAFPHTRAMTSHAAETLSLSSAKR